MLAVSLRHGSHLLYVAKTLYLLSMILLLSVLHSPSVIVVEGVPTPKALSMPTAAVFVGTKELLVSELKEREFEILLLRKALFDLSGNDHAQDGGSASDSIRPVVVADVTGEGAAATPPAAPLPQGDVTAAGGRGEMMRKEARSGKGGGLSLAARLRAVGQATPWESQAFTMTSAGADQVSHARLPAELVIEQSPGQLPPPHPESPTNQLLAHAELPQQLPVRLPEESPRQPPGRPPGWHPGVNGSDPASDSAAEASAEFAASRAARGVLTGMASLGRQLSNRSESRKESIKVLLEATGEIAQLKEAEVEKAQHLVEEIRQSREHEVELSNGLTATLNLEAADLEGIQKSFGM